MHGIGEKFSPDLHTGTGNFTVPIALPPGRNGFQPQLSLKYSTGTGNGPFGLGWALSIPGVSRKTSKGVPTYDPESDVFILSGVEDLVPVAIPIEQTNGVTRYHPRTEGLFAQILHHCDPQNDYWEVLSKDGLVSTYGTPRPPSAPAGWIDSAAIQNPDPQKPRQIFAWKLTSTQDRFGNRIEYAYERDPVRVDGPHQWDQVYLSEIRYVDYGPVSNPQFLVAIKFLYENRLLDPFSDYRAGFEIRTMRRCSRIEISTHATDTTLARTYELIYLDQLGRNDQLPLNAVSLLSQIKVVGHDNGQTQELPPLEFRYTQFQPNRRNFFPVEGTELPAISLADPNLEQANLFGDGLPDILEMNDTVRYWRNLGNGRFDLPREMRDAPAGLRLADSGVQLLDADGDGRVDLLVSTSELAGYFPLNFSGLWDRRSFRRYRAAPSFNLEDREVKLVDLDGDGVTDAIRSGTRLECFFNDPIEGWTRTRQVERRSLDEFPNVNFSDPRVKWGDMSGDGLQDIVLVYDGSIDYWPNLGYGNWGKRIHMRYSPRFPDGYNPKRILIGDIDGDGLADIVYVDNNKLTLWINRSGNAWSDPIVINGTPPVSDIDAVRLTDLLGSGISGVLWSADFSGLRHQNMFFLDFTGGVKPYLLSEMDNHIGAITLVRYAPSTQFYIEDQKKPTTRWRTPLPFPVQVVHRVEVIDELSQGRLTTEYRYHHGYWDGVEREFRGFGMVEQFDSETFGEGPPSVAAGAGLFNFSTIDFPGAASTILQGVNDNGQIVGAQRDANGIWHSLLTDTHSFSTFDPPGFAAGASQETSFAYGINGKGKIVGYVGKNDIPNPEAQAYIKRGESFSLYNHPNADPSKGTGFGGINDAGIRVGTYTDSANTLHGFIQDDNTTTLLESSPNIPANKGNFIFDINNLGQMVGSYFDALRDIQHGLLTDGTTFVAIDFPGSDTTYLNGINDLGQMVGAYFDNATQVFRGFLTDGNNFITIDYPNLPQGFGTFVSGIDNSGHIVGYYGAEVGLEGEVGRKAAVHGFRATPVLVAAALRTPVAGRHFSPPTCTKTWFHQGPVGDDSSDEQELDLSSEFWPGDGTLLQAKHTTSTFLRTLPDRRTRRDALRALRGSILRTELYALDGSLAYRPYTVIEYAYGLSEVSPRGRGDQDRLPIFFPHLIAQRTTHWERGNDPLTRFSFNDDYDEFGQLLRSTQIACPRGWRTLDDMPSEVYLATRTLTTYAKPADPNIYIVDHVARSTSYELTNSGQMKLDELHQLPDSRFFLSVFSQSYNYYDGPAFEGLPLGQIGQFGALVRSESLVLTEDLLHEAYKSGASVLDPPEEPPYLSLSGPPPWTAEYPDEFRRLVPPLGGYVSHPGGPDPIDARGYFAQTDRRRYDFQALSGTGRGLVTARRDPLGRDTEIAYDKFDFLPIKVAAPAKLITQAEHDYRVLQPRQVTDPNGNQSLFTFTPLGLLSETFVRGKPGEGDQTRPSVTMTYDFMAFLETKQADPNNPKPIYVHASRRVHHDSETDVPPSERDETIESREYSDGFGRLLQTRAQAEDVLFGDPVFGDTVLQADQGDQAGTKADVVGRQRNPRDPPNVVVSGWQFYDNKGRVVEKYEPFYSTGFEYSAPTDAQFGEKVERFYDPRGQVIRTVNPDGSEQRVIFGVPGSIAAPDLGNPDVFEPTPWISYTYDANDNAGRTHPDTSSAYRHHWNTPTNILVDALGRTILSVARNRDPPANPTDPLPPIEEIRTRSNYDIRGNVLTVTDALGRPAFTHVYDLANRPLRIDSIDAGIRRTILNAAGSIVERRDSKSAVVLNAYDVLNRPTHLWARDIETEVVNLRERLIYGDDPDLVLSDQEITVGNLLGKLYRHHDEAGLLSFSAYDFKGNLLAKRRQVISAEQILSVFAGPPANWKVQAYRVNWALNGDSSPAALEARAAVLLDPQAYQTSSTLDALNRVKLLRYPQDVVGMRRELYPTYNRAGALERVSLNGAIYVDRVAYNAKGQRVLIAYGNGVMTRYAYDGKTSHLSRLRTERFSIPASGTYRPAGAVLQDFGCDYDLVGNILAIRDRTPESGILNSALGADALDRAFIYDPIYRLLSASGRECDRPPDVPWDGAPRCTDLTKTRAYLEKYLYDDVGNIRQLKHMANSGGFTRDFALVADNTAPQNNRLKALTVNGNTYDYAYDHNGNRTQEAASRHFEWDHSDRMRVFRTQTENAAPTIHAQYLYDSGGKRTMKVVRPSAGPVEVTIYLDGIFEHRKQTSKVLIIENNSLHVMDKQNRVALFRIGQPFANDAMPPVAYHLADHLGSSNIVTGGANSAANDFINREEYSPYGETSFGAFARKRFRFVGQERDEETGFSYAGTRYYAPWLARWMSADPAGPVDSINLFQYVRANPLALVDRTGKDSSEPNQGATNGPSPEFLHENWVEMGLASDPTAVKVMPPVTVVASVALKAGQSRAVDEPDTPAQMPHASAGSSGPPLNADKVIAPTNNTSDVAFHDDPQTAITTSFLPEQFIISGTAGPIVRGTYEYFTSKYLGKTVSSAAEAERLINIRGGERLFVRGVTTFICLIAAWITVREALDHGEYGRAIVESIPALLTIGMNATLFVRDKLKYGSFLGAIGNPEKKAELVKRMLEGERVAGKTSEVWTGRFLAVGRYLNLAGWFLEAGRMLAADNPEAVRAQERQFEAQGRTYQCRPWMGVQFCGYYE